MHHIKSWGRTDVGRVRKNNQDAFLIRPHQTGTLLAVADGMGGGVAGDEASRMMVEELESVFSTMPYSFELATRLLEMAFCRVHLSIRETSSLRYQGRPMATTCTAAWLAEDGRVSMVHIGDSRLYHIQENGAATQCSQDHTVIADLIRKGVLSEEEGLRHPHRHVLSRSVGGSALFQLDLPLQFRVRSGQGLLLCSDGVTRHLSDEDLLRMRKKNGSGGRFVDGLVEEANKRGGQDNITAVTAFFGHRFHFQKGRVVKSYVSDTLSKPSQVRRPLGEPPWSANQHTIKSIGSDPL